MREEAGADLIARACHDRAAFGEIYDLYLRRVYSFCLARCANRDEAEDLTAQTFERALVAIGRYEDHGAPLSSWLFHITANAATDRARRSRRLVYSGDDALAAEGALPDGEPGPDACVQQWERALWLRGRVSRLSQDQQRVVRLRFYEDLSFADVAARMGRSEGAVKQLAQRALRTLRLELGEEAPSNA